MANRKKSSKKAASKEDEVVETTKSDQSQTDSADADETSVESEINETTADPSPEQTEPFEETVDHAAPKKDAEPADETATDDVTQDASEPTEDKAAEDVPSSDAVKEEAAHEDAVAGTAEDKPDISESETPQQPKPETPVYRQDVSARESGFFPMILGGVGAAAIGFAVAKFGLQDTSIDPKVITSLQDTINAQTDEITELTERFGSLDAGADTTALEEAQTSLKDSLDAAVSNLSERLTTLETQMSDIQSQPAGDTSSTVDLSAYEQQLSALRETVDTLSTNAALIEQNAQLAAQATLQRAALTRVFSAIDAGTGFAPAVADLQSLGVTVPDALEAASTGGVPSLSTLQDAFPDHARAALTAAREAAGDADGGGLTSFLRSSLGARSLQPREGSDPDAVLSRVEAAIRDGRLSDALAEIEALPEEGRNELSDWSSQVALRQNAVAAAQELSAQLN